MDTVERILEEARENARRAIEEKDMDLAEKYDDIEVLDSDVVSKVAPDFVDARERQIENGSKEIDREYTMSKEEADKEKADEITQALEEGIEKYLDETPSFAAKMVRKFMHLVQQEEDLEITKRKPLYKKFTPYVVLATMALSSIFTSKIKEKQFEEDYVSFPSQVENIFESVDQAPIPVMEAYVYEQTKGYYKGCEEDERLKNEEFEKAYRRFYSALDKDEVDLDELINSVKAIDSISRTDNIDETIPFENSVYSNSIVQNGEVLVPVRDESEVKDGEELTVHNGSLFKRGR